MPVHRAVYIHASLKDTKTRIHMGRQKFHRTESYHQTSNRSDNNNLRDKTSLPIGIITQTQAKTAATLGV